MFMGWKTVILAFCVCIGFCFKVFFSAADQTLDCRMLDSCCTTELHSQCQYLISCKNYPDWPTDLCNPYQNPSCFFAEIENPILKFIWNLQGAWKTQTFLKQKSKARGNSYPEFKTVQSYSNQNNMILIKILTHRPVE